MNVKVQVAPYCEKCSAFKPDIIHDCLVDGKERVVDRILILRCYNENHCSKIAGYIREELEKKAVDAER